MKEKQLISKNDQLVDLRSGALQRVRAQEEMKALGKVGEMDTFSWLNPPVEGVVNLLRSMPFKVIWMGQMKHVEELFQSEDGLEVFFDTVIVYDAGGFEMSKVLIDSHVTLLAVNDIQEASKALRTLKKKGSVLLFTNGGVNAVEYQSYFEEVTTRFIS